MKTKSKILFVTSLAPLLITAVALIFMDNTVPVHFGLNGTPDRYGSKFEYLILPIITLAFYVFWKLFIKFYTKSSTDEVTKVNTNTKTLTIFAIATNVLFGILQCILLVIAFISRTNPETTIDMFPLVVYACSITFIIIGNFLPKTKRNSFAGVRTAWTKKSDKNWYVANRNAGIAFVISGVLSIITTAIVGGSIAIFIMLVITFTALIISYIYSYIKVSKSK